MRWMIISWWFIISSIACFSGQSNCKVVIEDSKRVAILYAGNQFNLHGEAIPIDDLIYRVELKPASTVQNVFIWELTEFVDQENEYGKYYSLKGYRVEFTPNGSRNEVLPGSDLGFWGSQTHIGGKIKFKIKKFYGLPPFQVPQEMSFESVYGKTSN